MKHRTSRHGWLARAEGSGLDRCRSIKLLLGSMVRVWCGCSARSYRWVVGYGSESVVFLGMFAGFV
jgi:hypothetical protein